MKYDKLQIYSGFWSLFAVVVGVSATLISVNVLLYKLTGGFISGAVFGIFFHVCGWAIIYSYDNPTWLPDLGFMKSRVPKPSLSRLPKPGVNRKGAIGSF